MKAPDDSDKPIDWEFDVLGYDDLGIHFFIKKFRIKQHIRWQDLNDVKHLYRLTRNKEFWISNFPSDCKRCWSVDAASAEIERRAKIAGSIKDGKLIERTRGCGVWNDGSQVVTNLGSRLLVDGQPADDGFVSQDNRIYMSGNNLPISDDSTDNEECGAFIELLNAATLNEHYALMLSGFVCNSFLVGCVDTRPSVWVEGLKGVGKSHLRGLCLKAMGGWALSVEGTTEAALRQELGSNALAIFYDESESDNDREAESLTAVISLVRKAFDNEGGKTIRGTPTGGSTMSWQTRTCALMSSINNCLLRDRDRSRFISIKLSTMDGTQVLERNKKCSELSRLCVEKDGFSARLARRAVNYAPIHKVNMQRLASLLEPRFDEPRTAKVFASLLSGSAMFTHGREITEGEALSLIQGFNFDLFEADKSDEQEIIMTRLLSSQLDCGGSKPTVVELLNMITNGDKTHSVVLARAGLMLQERGLCVAYKTEGFLKMFKEEPWYGSSKRIKRELLAIAQKKEAERVRFGAECANQGQQSCIIISKEILESYIK